MDYHANKTNNVKAYRRKQRRYRMCGTVASNVETESSDESFDGDLVDDCEYTKQYESDNSSATEEPYFELSLPQADYDTFLARTRASLRKCPIVDEVLNKIRKDTVPGSAKRVKMVSSNTNKDLLAPDICWRRSEVYDTHHSFWVLHGHETSPVVIFWIQGERDSNETGYYPWFGPNDIGSRCATPHQTTSKVRACDATNSSSPPASTRSCSCRGSEAQDEDMELQCDESPYSFNRSPRELSQEIIVGTTRTDENDNISQGNHKPKEGIRMQNTSKNRLFPQVDKIDDSSEDTRSARTERVPMVPVVEIPHRSMKSRMLGVEDDWTIAEEPFESRKQGIEADVRMSENNLDRAKSSATAALRPASLGKPSISITHRLSLSKTHSTPSRKPDDEIVRKDASKSDDTRPSVKTEEEDHGYLYEPGTPIQPNTPMMSEAIASSAVALPIDTWVAPAGRPSERYLFYGNILEMDVPSLCKEVASLLQCSAIVSISARLVVDDLKWTVLESSSIEDDARFATARGVLRRVISKQTKAGRSMDEMELELQASTS
ncbi:MAG: hypothetical protein M1833_003148 [Piccolia ochrophora]|nr:MAG: hypothetical protein M1833_003148 [Piccolia ochrophora]